MVCLEERSRRSKIHQKMKSQGILVVYITRTSTTICVFVSVLDDVNQTSRFIFFVSFGVSILKTNYIVMSQTS
jgi:hypothetical protein